MQDIEQKAFAIYKKNLNYLKEQDKHLFDKINLLSTLIEEEKYRQKYALEYKQEGYFDIQEISTQNWLYNEHSNKYSDKLKNSVNYKRTGSVFEAQSRFAIDSNNIEVYGEMKNFRSSLWATAKIIDYNAKNAPKNNSEMKELYKFIFINTGLGLHVESIIKKFNIKVAFIYEDNLELFRLSLFVTDYSELSSKTNLIFSIMDSFKEIQGKFFGFLNTAFGHNLYIKFIPFNHNYQEVINNLQSITLSQNHIMYPYQAFMSRSFSSAAKVSSGKSFINVRETYLNTPLSNKPVLLLAAGPSLQNNLKWVKENYVNFIVIAVFSVCEYLLNEEIVPDIIMHIDPEEQENLNISEEKNKQLLKNTIIIIGSSVHEKLINNFKKENLYVIEESTSFKRNFGFFTMPTIGEYSAFVSLILGTNELYLLGVDQALDPNTMKDHIDSHIYSATVDKDKETDSVLFQESICYIKGNFLDKVPTKPNFRLSVTQFANAVKKLKQPYQNIYNLSNGAYLEETIPTHIESISEMQSIDKKLFRLHMNDFLQKNISSIFTEEDKAYLQKQIDIAENILCDVVRLRKQKSKKADSYLNNKLLPFMQKVCEVEKEDRSDIGEIFYEYFKISASFVFDTLNTKKLENEKKHVTNIDKIVLDEVEKIAKLYLEKMKSYMK